LSVTQGKGLTDQQARISAFMEAAEYAFAENALPLVKCIGTADDMTRQGHRVMNVAALPMVRSDHYDHNKPRHWVVGQSLVSGQPILAPYETIGMDMRVNGGWDNPAIRMSSVGLAAAYTYENAVRHALFEVIENDATALLDAVGMLSPLMNTIDASTFTAPDLLACIRMVEAAGLVITFHAVSSGTGYPVIGANIEEAVDSGPRRRFGGYGARGNKDQAALAALLEAVQSRLTDISGAREDIDPEEFTHIAKSRSNQTVPSVEKIAEFEQPQPPPIAEIVENCRKAGAEDFVVFPLGGESIGIHVVKVLAPGLDMAFGDAGDTMGHNMLRAFLQLGQRSS
jgi:ribosomal protein S12 methylthiotransferase accessory factor